MIKFLSTVATFVLLPLLSMCQTNVHQFEYTDYGDGAVKQNTNVWITNAKVTVNQGNLLYITDKVESNGSTIRCISASYTHLPNGDMMMVTPVDTIIFTNRFYRPRLID